MLCWWRPTCSTLSASTPIESFICTNSFSISFPRLFLKLDILVSLDRPRRQEPRRLDLDSLEDLERFRPSPSLLSDPELRRRLGLVCRSTTSNFLGEKENCYRTNSWFRKCEHRYMNWMHVYYWQTHYYFYPIRSQRTGRNY